MRDEAREFFASTGQHVQKMLDPQRRKNLKPSQIEAAAEELYCQIENGLEIHPIDYYPTIKDIAKGMESKEADYVQRKAVGEHYRKVCEQNDCLKKENFWLAVSLLVMTALTSVAGAMLSSVYLGGF